MSHPVAAVMIASHAKANALGVPADRRVYLRGWCYAKDPVYVAERADLWRSLAMQEASREALRRAGCEVILNDAVAAVVEDGRGTVAVTRSGRRLP